MILGGYNQGFENDSPQRRNFMDNEVDYEDPNLGSSGYLFNRTIEDSQFQPPNDNFGMQNEFTQMDPDAIDQKIMQNIQKYISTFVTPQTQAPPQQPVNQISNFHLNNSHQQAHLLSNQPQIDSYSSNYAQTSYLEPQIKPQPQRQPTDFQTFNAQPLLKPTLIQPQVQQQPPQIQPLVQQPTFSLQSSSTPIQESQIQSEEFLMLKQVIEGLNKKLDQMTKLTENLQATVESKDREIQKIRSIYSMKGQRSELRESIQKQKVKKERGVQTAINLIDNQKEYETFSYLYDKDQDLIRSEKEALLKYMRKEVIQNQEFLDRITELEQENQSLQDEILMYQNSLAKSNMIIQESYDQMQSAEDEKRLRQQDQEINCDILIESEFLALQSQVALLQEQLSQEQNTVRELENTLAIKQEEFNQNQDTTNHQLYQENTRLRSILEQRDYDIQQYKSQLTDLMNEKEILQAECERLNTYTQQQEKQHTEQIQKMKQQTLQQVDKLNQEKDKLSKSLNEKEQKIWDLNAKLEEQQKLITEMEEQLDKKKKKNKKQNECMECFKKEAEIQTLQNKIYKLSTESSSQINDLQRQIKQKENQIQDSQLLIKSLSEQLQQNISKGGNDPIIQQHIQKIEKENQEKDVMIEQLKSNMQKQAAQFMMQLIQQEQSSSQKSLSTSTQNNIPPKKK